ncbi:MAG TPA: prenyltransferase/squalene oxidase repeat-containing protein [Candidatus Acidoferrum sp.]|nr:prenyltransferase/squalene oxidase repeat-containing protein [Candidatus Acidoferrum sp.]
MSIRLEMLQVARLAPKLLGDSAELVGRFIQLQQNSDGGFKDRVGRSDLYYTVFGLDALTALQLPLPTEQLRKFVTGFDPVTLDLVHLCALIRCWAAVGEGGPRDAGGTLRARLADFRARDGGYNPIPNSEHGTAYGAFLAVAAYQDMRTPIVDSSRLVESFNRLATIDGAWTNEVLPIAAIGATNATAAVVTVLRNLGAPISSRAAEWLLARTHPQGGFLAIPGAPIPDLLSTATALHALAGLGVPLDPVKDACLDFIDTLWANDGAFHGNWTDDHLDCEYTFYGLLALGHLAV